MHRRIRVMVFAQNEGEGLNAAHRVVETKLVGDFSDSGAAFDQPLISHIVL